VPKIFFFLLVCILRQNPTLQLNFTGKQWNWLQWQKGLGISVWCRQSVQWLTWPMGSLELAAGWDFHWTSLGEKRNHTYHHIKKGQRDINLVELTLHGFPTKHLLTNITSGKWSLKLSDNFCIAKRLAEMLPNATS